MMMRNLRVQQSMANVFVGAHEYLIYIIKCVFFFCFRISPRTPVTQNDPLGALNEEDEIIKIEKTPAQKDKIIRVNNNNNTIYSDQPILFKGQRSATFDESTNLNKSMQRSETMPPSSVTASLVGLGSTLKFNFG